MKVVCHILALDGTVSGQPLDVLIQRRLRETQTQENRDWKGDATNVIEKQITLN